MHVRGRQIPRPEQMAFENAARGTNGFFPEYFALESICRQGLHILALYAASELRLLRRRGGGGGRAPPGGK